MKATWLLELTVNMMTCFSLIVVKFKQVEKVFGASHPDPIEIEKAKKVLKVRTKHLRQFILYVLSFLQW